MKLVEKYITIMDDRCCPICEGFEKNFLYFDWPRPPLELLEPLEFRFPCTNIVIVDDE